MGGGSVGQIFDPLAKTMIRMVDSGKMELEEAIGLLAILAEGLRDGDWDTIDESVEAANSHPVVMQALARTGWEPEEYED